MGTHAEIRVKGSPILIDKWSDGYPDSVIRQLLAMATGFDTKPTPSDLVDAVLAITIVYQSMTMLIVDPDTPAGKLLELEGRTKLPYKARAKGKPVDPWLSYCYLLEVPEDSDTLFTLRIQEPSTKIVSEAIVVKTDGKDIIAAIPETVKPLM